MGRHHKPSPLAVFFAERRAVVAALGSAALAATVLTAATFYFAPTNYTFAEPTQPLEDLMLTTSPTTPPGTSTADNVTTTVPAPARTATTPTPTAARSSASSAPREKDQPATTRATAVVPPAAAIRDEAEPTTVRPTPSPTVTPPAPIAAPEVGPDCRTSGFGGVAPHVAQVGFHLSLRWGVALSSIIGVANRSNTSDHPRGLALDFLVSREKGDNLAEYVVANRGKFAVTYVIWRQRINFGDGWEMMEDRGSATANHYDHVHVSFASRGSGEDIAC